MIHTCKITNYVLNNIIAPNIINLIYYQNKAYQNVVAGVFTCNHFSLQSQS